MDQPDFKTFCVAPWFQIRNNNDMQKRVCCAIQPSKIDNKELSPIQFLNSDENISLKTKLHNGIKAVECSLCWKNEDKGTLSLRQRLNSALTANANSSTHTWLHSYFNKKKDFMSDKILITDIKIGNTCNYACVMCVPDDSSLIYNRWKKDKNTFFIKEKLDKDPVYFDRIKSYGYKNILYRNYINDLFQNKDLKYLKFTGGEPLLDKNLLDKLYQIPVDRKSKIILYFTTNGSQDMCAVREYLRDFKKVIFTVSIEGVGTVQEYARYGSDWNTVSKNIINFKKKYPSDISVAYCIQTTTVLGFFDLCNWTKENDIPLTLMTVEEPEWLSLVSLPIHCREKLRKFVKHTKINIVQDTHVDGDTISGEDIISYIDALKFDIENYKRFIKYIEWYERNNNNGLKLIDMFPELYIDNNQ